MSNITFQEEGKRVYVLGNTFPIKSAIKDCGGHWDGDKKAWWIGAKKKEELQRVINGAKPEAQERRETTVMGKADYNGHSYYIAWMGMTKHGESARLVSLDEKLDFWKPVSEIRITKTYQRRESNNFYGRKQDLGYPTLSGIRNFIEKKRSEEKSGVQEETKRCWECGCSFTKQDARSNQGDWQDSYCGC
jgi:hypothetical protein